MLSSNYPKILKMLYSRSVRKYLSEINKSLKKDKNYSQIKMARVFGKLLSANKIVSYNGQYSFSPIIPPIPSLAFKTFLYACQDKENLFTSMAFAKRTAPLTFTLALTSKCNYNCEYCSAKGRKDGEELTTEKWIEVIRDLQDMGTAVIEFTGGEPMLRDDLEKIIKAVDDRSISLLFTNGSELTAERAKSLRENGLFGTVISLDSSDADFNNNIQRNSKAYENSVEALKNSIQAGLYTMIACVVLKSQLTEEKMFRLFEFAKSIGVHEIILIEPVVTGNLLKADKLDDYIYTDDDRKKLIDIQKHGNKKFRNLRISSEAFMVDKKMFGCAAGIQHSYLSSTGELLPCDFVPLSFGNVKETPIKELWIQMRDAIGMPQGTCLGKRIKEILKDKPQDQVPIQSNESQSIIEGIKDSEVPGVYKLLQGKQSEKLKMYN